MMKFIAALILTVLSGYASCLFLPWWSIAIAAFVIAFIIKQKPGWAFVSAFLGLFFLWAVLSYTISSNNAHVLASKISLLILKVKNVIVLILLTGFIGGLVAGMAALSGSLLRKIIWSNKV